MNHPDWHPIAQSALIWDSILPSLDLPDVCGVADATECYWEADRVGRINLYQGMEGSLKIQEELSVDRMMSRGHETVNYVSQTHEYLVHGH